MLHRFKKITKLWHSKKIRTIFLGFVILGFIIGAYSALPYPYLKGVDASQTINKVSFNAPITLHFSQGMNKKSVEENFKIHPRLKGDFVWIDGKTLEFHSETALKIDDRYKIVIESGAKNLFGKSLGSDVSIHFLVTGPPYVKFVAPFIPREDYIVDQMDQSEPKSVPVVSSDQIITVMFDRPMNWQNTKEDELLYIDPPVNGKYRFLGMSAFQFIPESWTTGTRFKITVPSGIQARDGGETENEFIWYIETTPLRIIETFPKLDEEHIGIDTPLKVIFNQPVDLSQIQPGNNSLLYPSNDVDADTNPKFDGFFNTEVTYGKDSHGIVDKTILIFEPTFPYLYNADYKFVIKAGLSGVSSENKGIGALGMKQDYELEFKTAMAPGVIDFAQPSSDYPNIIVSFSTDMTVKEIQSHLSISPEPLSPITIIMSEDNRKAEVLSKFLPNTEYTFDLNAPLKDIAGNEIKDNFSEKFTVDAPDQKLQWESESDWDIYAENVEPEFMIKSKNVNEIQLELCQVTERNFMTTSEKQAWEDYSCYSTPVPFIIRSEDGSALLNMTSIFKRELEPGVYYFSAKNDNKKIFRTFFVSNTTLVLKKSQNSLLLWATDFITGEPVSRMELAIYNYRGEEISRGVTDGYGIYKITRDFEEGVYILSNFGFVSASTSFDGYNRENSIWVKKEDGH